MSDFDHQSDCGDGHEERAVWWNRLFCKLFGHMAVSVDDVSNYFCGTCGKDMS